MSCKKCKTSKCTCETNICINPLIYLFKNVFSLVGTDTNNLTPLEILQKISRQSRIPITKAETTLETETAIKYEFTATALNAKDGSYILDLTTALIDILTGGISISNNKNICCPDCKNGLYYLGGAQQFIILHQALINSTTRICCLEHASSIETWLQVLEATENQYKCCDTDFNEQLELWMAASSSSTAYFNLDDILAIGILESSSFNGYSGLGILFNYLQLNHPELTSEDYLNILGVIVNLGIVIQCNGCEIIMSSVETYLKWAEATNGGGGGPVPA